MSKPLVLALDPARAATKKFRLKDGTSTNLTSGWVTGRSEKLVTLLDALPDSHRRCDPRSLARIRTISAAL